MGQKFPGLLRWSVINSIAFFLGVQLFYHASALALAIAFLDQAHPKTDVSYMAGLLLVLTAQVLIVGPIIGLFLGAYQGEVFYKLGIKRRTWLQATMIGTLIGYGFFVYSQILRVYLDGLQNLFAPSVSQCLFAAALSCVGLLYVLYRNRLSYIFWVVTTITFSGTAIFATYAFRHTAILALTATLVIAVAYSVLLYLILTHTRLESSKAV